MKSFRLFIQLSRPIYILNVALLYLLGSGIAHYLIGQISWPSFFLGLVWVVLIMLGFQYVNEYFEARISLNDSTMRTTPFSGGSGAIGEGKLPRQLALWAGLTCLTITASLTALMYKDLDIGVIGGLLLGLILLGELLFILPPVRLVASGYGEVVMSLIHVGLVPALALILQGHDFHRLLIMVGFPLTTLYLGMLLALEFPDYAVDLKHGNKPILIRIGWQTGMLLHNLLVLGSFVILGIAFVFGLPLRVFWPVIFVLPVGLFQVWMMNRIGDGAKPNWNLLMLVAISSYGLATYIFTFAFWIN